MTTTKIGKYKSKHQPNEILKLNPKLPQIVIPKSKIDMFIDWYNEDLRFQDTIPKAFEEGYLVINNDIIQIKIEDCNNYIKSLAKELNTTYRIVEDRLKDFLYSLDNITLYFKFLGNRVEGILYDNKNRIVSALNFELGTGTSEFFESKHITKLLNTWDETLNEFNCYCVILLASSLWYIATTKSHNYYYERNNEPKVEEKEIKHVKHFKTIATPIYDMNKVKRVKTEHLIKRRKGWTYSHSFQVHGHYRHYKNGKVVFVNSYIKGKNELIQNQIITLDPKEAIK